jgi:glyoxylase-like metal-dependent hydrolase (beta-lactamase superfamily II)
MGQWLSPVREKSVRKIGFGFIAILLFVMPAWAQQDFSKVEIKATKVAGNVYMLEGSGGNIGVSVGADGILIVDDEFAPLADKIKTALKGLGTGKLKFILNTHWHGDHTGSNAVFGPEDPIIAQTNVRKRLAEGSNMPYPTVDPPPQEALPVISRWSSQFILMARGDSRHPFPRGIPTGTQ